ncbi:MAG: DUF167 domain-containing protein [Chloroflexi bacterium]|nr:DUF167 domain-containing protein [Chloroflexota bacterium]
MPQTRLTVAVRPGARRSEIREFKDGVLQVRIAAPPVEGKANRELIQFLSDVLEVARSNITIERGLTGKLKVVLVRGLDPDAVTKRLKVVP